jgi:hypothetical protein
MIVFGTEQLLCCDIDGTLLMWGKEYQRAGNKTVFIDPYTDKQVSVTVNRANFKVFKDRLTRGAKFIVWSQSGFPWAKACMEALGFQDNPNIIVTSKPIAYIDDKECSKWMGDHVNLDMNDAYGIK